MKVPRRALVASGARFAAALAVAPGLIRLPGCRTAPFSRAVPAGEPSAERLCSSRVTGPPDRPLPRQPLHPDSLPRFVDRLPVPRVLRPSGTRPHPDKPRAAPVPVFRVAMKATEVRVHRDLPPTRMWGYEGEVPGPTIAVRRGEPLFVEWANELPERHFLPIDRTLHGAHEGAPEVRTVVHVHGAKAPPESDGYPESWFLAGSAATAFYPNDQEATTLWYHDHTMGIERLNQYAGLFGFFLIREAAEAEAASSLPHGAYDIPLALCDRLFDVDAQLVYPTSGRTRGPWVSEVLGDAHLVNGKLAPFVEVEPRRYRLRVLNASNSRFYYLSLTDDQPMWQVGTDQGLLSAPVSLQRKMIAPGERVDLVVDFRHLSGREAYLQNQTTKLLQFRVGTMKSPGEAPMPTTLRTLPRIEARAAVRTRTLTLKEHVDPATRAMIMLLDGRRWADPITERPVVDSVEIWELVNLTDDSHPIHLHAVRFQLLSTQGYDYTAYQRTGRILPRGAALPPMAEDAGWKDTIRAEAGLITRIIVRFDAFPGRYVWHCHVLEHAANEMMRPFEIVST